MLRSLVNKRGILHGQLSYGILVQDGLGMQALCIRGLASRAVVSSLLEFAGPVMMFLLNFTIEISIFLSTLSACRFIAFIIIRARNIPLA